VFALLSFYGLRAFFQYLDVLEFPEGNMWSFPGWFSLFVPYGTTPDFYYSGHVGSCIIHYLEFEACGLFWLSIYAIFVMLM